MIILKPAKEKFIEDQIERTEVQKRLKEICSKIFKIRDRSRFEMFSDGLLDSSGIGIGKTELGISWVISRINSRVKKIEFSSKFNNWPVSTRAKLGVIWTALLL